MTSSAHLSPLRANSPHLHRQHPHHQRRLSDEPTDRLRRPDFLLSTPARPTDRPPAQPLPHASPSTSSSSVSSNDKKGISAKQARAVATDASSPILSDLVSPASPPPSSSSSSINRNPNGNVPVNVSSNASDRRATSFRDDASAIISSDITPSPSSPTSLFKFPPSAALRQSSPSYAHQQQHHMYQQHNRMPSPNQVETEVVNHRRQHHRQLAAPYQQQQQQQQHGSIVPLNMAVRDPNLSSPHAPPYYDHLSPGQHHYEQHAHYVQSQQRQLQMQQQQQQNGLQIFPEHLSHPPPQYHPHQQHYQQDPSHSPSPLSEKSGVYSSGAATESPLEENGTKKWMTDAVVSAGYVVKSVVSEGSFGTVLKAQRLSDQVFVALKAVPKARLSDKDCATIRKQALALRALKHRYIVQFHDDFEDRIYFYHVFEFLHGGDLYERLETRGKPFSEAQVLFLARQIFYAVSYMHSKRAAHRDIKLENFVFETSPSDERQVMKLIDFDLLIVRSRQSPRTETCTEMCGTILYVSPEIASGREHVPEESDMWACGVMLFVLLSYQMPFQGASGRHILWAVRTTEPHFAPAIWANVSAGTKALVMDLLNKNAAERPTAEQALERVKMIQSQARQSGGESSSRLKALTRGLRSVSLNLWDQSGNLARRGTGRHSDMRPSAGGTVGTNGQSTNGVGAGNGRVSSGSGVLATGGEWDTEGGSSPGPRSAPWRGSGRDSMVNATNATNSGASNVNEHGNKRGGKGHGGGGSMLSRRRRGARGSGKSRRARSQARMVDMLDDDLGSSPSTSMMSMSGSLRSSSTQMQSDSVGRSEAEVASATSMLHHHHHHNHNHHEHDHQRQAGGYSHMKHHHSTGTTTAAATVQQLDVKSFGRNSALAMDCGGGGGGGGLVEVDEEGECLTSPALGGFVVGHRAHSVVDGSASYSAISATRGVSNCSKFGRRETGSRAHARNGLRASLGGGGVGNGDGGGNGDGKKGDAGGAGHGHGGGRWFGDVGMLRGSRRLKRSGYGFGARLRQMMHKGEDNG